MKQTFCVLVHCDIGSPAGKVVRIVAETALMEAHTLYLMIGEQVVAAFTRWDGYWREEDAR